MVTTFPLRKSIVWVLSWLSEDRREGPGVHARQYWHADPQVVVDKNVGSLQHSWQGRVWSNAAGKRSGHCRICALSIKPC